MAALENGWKPLLLHAITIQIHYRKVHKQVTAGLLFRLQATGELLFLLGFYAVFQPLPADNGQEEI